MSLIITSIEKKSIFYPLGIRKGDKIISINNRRIYDYYGVVYEAEKKSMNFLIRTAGGDIIEKKLTRKEYESIHIEFEDFPIMKCANQCIFCFIDQNPPNLRKSIYIKDDDYRFSLEHGNFITLSNLSDSMISNIIEHKLSPMYVSVHSSEEAVRTKLFGRVNNLKAIEKLTGSGIKIHAQIVLVRDVNDKEHLIKTLEYAKERGFLSTGIVPCGLTKFRQGLKKIKTMDKTYMTDVVEMVESWKESVQFKRVYLADEFFLKSESSIPPKGYYGKFEQIENGIGMMRKFIMETSKLKKFRLKPNHAIITGGLFGKFLIDNRYFGGDRIYIADNKFMGGNVATAGLLSGSDIIENALKIRETDILISSTIFNDEGLTLDGMKVLQIEKKSKKVMHVITDYSEMREFLCL